MKLIDIRSMISQSGPDNWHVIGCWGHGSGPSYRDDFSTWTDHDGASRIRVKSHDVHGVYRDDVALTIDCGMAMTDEDDKRRLEWAITAFDEDALIFDLADVFYAGVLVDRVYTVAVDGGRAILPVPHSGGLGEPPRVSAYKRDVARVVHEFEHHGTGHESFDSYMNSAGIIVDE